MDAAVLVRAFVLQDNCGLTPNRPKRPVAQPNNIFVVPQRSIPSDRPINLIVGTDIRLPVHQIAPPSIAHGSNGGNPSAKLTTTPTKNIPEHNTQLKKTPSPVSTVLTGTKLDPKNTTAMQQHNRATVVDTMLFFVNFSVIDFVPFAA